MAIVQVRSAEREGTHPFVKLGLVDALCSVWLLLGGVLADRTTSRDWCEDGVGWMRRHEKQLETVAYSGAGLKSSVGIRGSHNDGLQPLKGLSPRRGGIHAVELHRVGEGGKGFSWAQSPFKHLGCPMKAGPASPTASSLSLPADHLLNLKCGESFQHVIGRVR